VHSTGEDVCIRRTSDICAPEKELGRRFCAVAGGTWRDGRRRSGSYGQGHVAIARKHAQTSTRSMPKNACYKSSIDYTGTGRVVADGQGW
jgi:hypothetical protein